MLIKKRFTIDTAHRLMFHTGLCSNIHGHTYQIDVTISGVPDANDGLVMDFKDLKEVVNSFLEHWDHALILHVNDPIEIVNVLNLRVVRYHWHPTAENMAIYLGEQLHLLNLPVYQVEIFETPTSSAIWTNENLNHL